MTDLPVQSLLKAYNSRGDSWQRKCSLLHQLPRTHESFCQVGLQLILSVLKMWHYQIAHILLRHWDILAGWERVIALPGKLIAVFLLFLLSWTKSCGQKWMEQTLELDVGWKLLQGITLSHLSSSSCDFRAKSVRTCVLQGFRWAARWTARHCTYPPHGIGVCTNQNGSHWITSSRELDETMSCQRKREKVCNDRQQQGTWWLAAGTSIIQTPVMLWPPAVPLMQVPAGSGRTSCC